ncbi:MAG: 4-(cytidine 5'-diphospho)-2-C-methyl-D-erythritol kinase [Candidatus Rokuibacteriota bacterium]|nr:MAG: 4-(cytidine 5'-diphospho)-2-C-methyl-D-erythritol kinase [Candidatus Rokubacteria bacterium]
MLAYAVLSNARCAPVQLVVSAGAKVNLVLEVLGQRDDGYHEIVTVMQAIDLSDRLTFDPADTLELATSSPDVPVDETNLVMRAARALRAAAGIASGARITLAKQIPVAAGLGGGSSDAAATLIGLDRLWGLRWPIERLDEIAVTIGMDVPFFLRGGAALGTARGDRLESVDGRPLAFVLINPAIPVSASEAYGRVSPALYTDGTQARDLAGRLGRTGATRVAAALYNALEKAVAPVHPEIGRMRAAALAAGGLGAAMSGSGPTVFGMARSFEHARQLRARLTRGSWRCWATRALRGPAIRVRTITRERLGTGHGR